MKKLLALLLVLLLTFSLAACTNNENTDPSGSDNPGTSQSGESDDPGASQTENQGGERTDGSEENDDVGTIYDIEGEFSAKQIAFIESLGKSEEGKKFVAFKEENGYVEFYVAEWNEDTTLNNLIHYTVYYSNASYTASERYKKAMDDYQSKWDLYESQGIDPSTALTNYKDKSEELCMTSVDRTDSVFGQEIVNIETYEDIARSFYKGATLVE